MWKLYLPQGYNFYTKCVVLQSSLPSFPSCHSFLTKSKELSLSPINNYIVYIFLAFENVWKEVENLPEAERIVVDYETLEKLFCRKLIAKAQNKPKVKPPKEVSGNNQTCILFPGFSGNVYKLQNY